MIVLYPTKPDIPLYVLYYEAFSTAHRHTRFPCDNRFLYRSVHIIEEGLFQIQYDPHDQVMVVDDVQVQKSEESVLPIV